MKLFLTALTKEDVGLALKELPVGDTLSIEYSNGKYDGLKAHKAASIVQSAANAFGYDLKVLKKSGQVLVTKKETKS